MRQITLCRENWKLHSSFIIDVNEGWNFEQLQALDVRLGVKLTNSGVCARSGDGAER